MKILSTEKKELAVVFEVELDLPAYKKAYAEAKKNISKNISIPGFRKGHVPANIINERVTPAQIGATAIEKQQSEVIKFIFDSKEFQDSNCLDSVSNIEISKFDDDKSAPAVKVSVDVVPTIENFTTEDLKKISVPPFTSQIKEEFIQQQIKAMTKGDAMIASKETSNVEKGDIAVIDFEGFVDGVAFQGGKANDFELEIGSKSFVDTFEDQIIGHKKGDEFDVNVTFPTNYAKNLAGKKAVFKVVIKDVKTIEYPEITKEYLKKFNINASTKQELENYLRDLFTQQEEMQYQNVCTSIINQAIASQAKLNYYPNGLLNMHINQVLRQYEQEAQRNGYKNLAAYKNALKLDDAKFNETVITSAKQTLAIALVYDKLMDEAKIKVEDVDLANYMKKLTKYVGDEAKAKEQFEKNKDYCESVILREKLIKKLIEYCKKEFKAEKAE